MFYLQQKDTLSTTERDFTYNRKMLYLEEKNTYVEQKENYFGTESYTK